MFPLARIASLAAAGALVALTAASIPARAGELTQNAGQVGSQAPAVTTVGPPDLNSGQIGECHQLKRAISRRACQARLWREMNVDTAEN